MAPIEVETVVRGQFRGYATSVGVRKDSQTETFAALKLAINSWRGKEFPFYCSGRQTAAVTCTEIFGRFP
jgi:glucose-6-phosphate 1-dehydrogenase